ncbi:hypothetical protein OA50_02360 [Mameliella alba]|uniref:Uncharacterized protein n=1 Tax=Mameliella alba TaxID=561184 RepID=A0A0B3RXJ3_9RHOB|nr:hypothetical protein OA50_02360 [Mameliella alba]
MLTGTIRNQVDQIWNAFWSVEMLNHKMHFEVPLDL